MIGYELIRTILFGSDELGVVEKRGVFMADAWLGLLLAQVNPYQVLE
jgi:hypothetical protein